MKETQNSAPEAVSFAGQLSPVEMRIFRTMSVAVAVALLASLLLAPWRVTTGLLLGGILSLLNHNWLIKSSRASFSVLAHGTKPKLRMAGYVLRYFVISAAVFLAYRYNLVSLVATFAGLSSFVVWLFVEAAREFYFAIFHREEIS